MYSKRIQRSNSTGLIFMRSSVYSSSVALHAYGVYAYCILMGIIKKTIRKQNIRFDIVLNIQVFLMNVEMEYYLNVFLRTVCIKYHITSQKHAHLSATYPKHFRLANHQWNNNQFY